MNIKQDQLSCIISGIIKSEGVNLLQNSVLTQNSRLYNFLFIRYKKWIKKSN